MPALTLTPDGGGAVTVPVALDGWDMEYEETQIIERRLDNSAGSLTIDASTTGRIRASVQTPAMTTSARQSLETDLKTIGTVTADGDLLDSSVVCRVLDISWDAAEKAGFERVRFTLREVG